MKVIANAKLNLSLDIVGIREDSYHLLDMVMQSISLSDTLCISTDNTREITIESDSFAVPLDERNLVYKAATAIMDHCNIKNKGVKIFLNKIIPTEAGLGGGSADAAATLLALRKLLKLRLDDEELCSIGLSIGADVPFCLHGGTARVSGIGEKIKPLSHLTGCCFVVAMPEEGISTANAFSLIDQKTIYTRPSTEELIEALESNNIEKAASLFKNVFQTSGVVTSSDTLIEKIFSFGALSTSLTGTGSAVFGTFTKETDAINCITQLENSYRCLLAYPVNSGVLFI